jgi:Zn finger protein HypA/HybF involved in hydrogenase expression
MALGVKKPRRPKKLPRLDLLCECDKCKLVHSRGERERLNVKKENSIHLFAYVCPKCKSWSYIVLGDTKKIRKRKDD